MSTTDEVAPLIINTNYGSTPSSDSNSPSTSICCVSTTLNKNKKLTSCCILSCASLLIIAFGFVIGVMYVNVNDTVLSIFTNSHPSHSKHSISRAKSQARAYIQSHALGDPTDVSTDPTNPTDPTPTVATIQIEPTVPVTPTNYSCSDSYPYSETTTSSEIEYYCYTSTDECEYCYDNNCDDDDDCEDECDDVNDAASSHYLDIPLYCYYIETDTCFAWDSIVTRLVETSIASTSGEDNIITQDVMIRDIKLGDYVLSGLNGEFSKVIDRTHYTPYEGSMETSPMREICFDKEGLEGEESDVVLYNCIRLTKQHLIYVNGIDLDSIKPSGEVKIGDYLYHTGLNKFVEVSEIIDGKNDYYRNIITESGNIVINNGFYSSTVPVASRFGNEKYMHLSMVYVANMFYRVFTLNGMYDGVWNSYYFDHILRLPAKHAIMKWLGMNGLYSQLEEYKYPLISSVCLQSIGCFLIYLIVKGFKSLFNNAKQC